MKVAVLLRVGIVLTAGCSTTTTTAVAPPTPSRTSPAGPVAMDGQRLADQPAETQATFEAVWGNRAAQRWVDEHDAHVATIHAGNLSSIALWSDSNLDHATSPTCCPGMRQVLAGARMQVSDRIRGAEVANAGMGTYVWVTVLDGYAAGESGWVPTYTVVMVNS